MAATLGRNWKYRGHANWGSISPLEEHADWLLALISQQSDLTLDEIVAAMRKRRIAGSRSAVWRFFRRHNISFKNSYAAEQKRADVARARRRWMREQAVSDPARLVFIDETCTNTAMVRLRGRAPRGARLVDYAPQGHWKTITFVGGLRQRAMTAPFVLEGAMNGPMFLAYVKQCLVPTSQTRRDRAHGQPAGAQGRRRRGGHRRSGRDADLSSEVFAGPQPNRIGLQQTQGASAQGGRAYDLASLASDRSRRYRFHRTRMLQLFPTCRIRFYMTGIRALMAGKWYFNIHTAANKGGEIRGQVTK